MSGTGVSRIGTPLADRIPDDGDWNQIQTNASQRFDVLIHAEDGRADAARRHARGVADVRGAYDDTIHAEVRADAVRQLANGTGVRLVEELADPIAHSTSEGVQTTHADDVQNLGVTGEDVTVAVIDQQFNPDQNEITDQVIDQIGNSTYFRPGVSGLHGTACAEIVAEMLPDADLVLATALGNSFPNLMDDITNAHDVDVMSMSLGYKPTIRLDGQDYISTRIIDYTNNGGLFCVSAGNEANGAHWDGQFKDTSGNGYMEFDDAGTERLPVETTDSGQEVVVQSDVDWSEDQGYSLELWDSQTGGSNISDPSMTSTPAQAISLPGSSGSTTTSYLAIKNESLTGSEHFDIFTWGNYVSLPTFTKDRSIGIPGTSPDAETLTVAAVRHNTDNLESFSSRGPTQDGRRGVDIAAPDGTDSDAYSGEFYGTSSACPHAAGVTGLIADFATATNVDVREVLFDKARAISDGSVSAPVNDEIGYGYVHAKDAFDDLIGVTAEWSKATGARAQFASPAVDDQRVYVGGLGTDVVAYARDGSTTDWSMTRDGALSDSSPVLDGGTVYVGSGGGTLYALNAADGSTAWSVGLGSAVTSTPAVLGSTVFVGTNDGTIHARATADGSSEWSTDVGAAVYSDVAATNGRVFVATQDGSLVALDASSGNESWRVDTGVETGSSSPTVANGTAYFAADAVYAYDESTGSNQWSAAYGGTAGSSPAYQDGILFVGSADGSIYALDATASGSQLWTFATGDAVAATPHATADRVTVSSLDGSLYVLDPDDGSKLGEAPLPSETRSSPVVDGNDVYLGTKDGTVLGR